MAGLKGGFTMDINLDEIEAFVESDDFSSFLLDNTSNFGVAAFVLDVLLKKIQELRNS